MFSIFHENLFSFPSKLSEQKGKYFDNSGKMKESVLFAIKETSKSFKEETTRLKLSLCLENLLYYVNDT